MRGFTFQTIETNDNIHTRPVVQQKPPMCPTVKTPHRTPQSCQHTECCVRRVAASTRRWRRRRRCLVEQTGRWCSRRQTAQVLVVMEEQRWRSWPVAWANVKSTNISALKSPNWSRCCSFFYSWFFTRFRGIMEVSRLSFTEVNERNTATAKVN